MEAGNSPKSLTKRRFFLESLAILLIIVSPFIFKLHEYLPKDPEAEVMSLLGIEITKNGFYNISTHVWFLLGKIIPLYLLVIWFLTCKHWWYHILLIPICMYAFQIFEVIYSEDDTIVDTENLLWLLPVCMVVIPFVYFIRLKLFDKYVHGIDVEAMNAELEYYKNKEKAELERAGIDVYQPVDTLQEDLSNETPKRTLNEIMQQLQQAMKSILSL